MSQNNHLTANFQNCANDSSLRIPTHITNQHIRANKRKSTISALMNQKLMNNQHSLGINKSSEKNSSTHGLGQADKVYKNSKSTTNSSSAVIGRRGMYRPSQLTTYPKVFVEGIGEKVEYENSPELTHHRHDSLINDFAYLNQNLIQNNGSKTAVQSPLKSAASRGSFHFLKNEYDEFGLKKRHTQLFSETIPPPDNKYYKDASRI